MDNEATDKIVAAIERQTEAIVSAINQQSLKLLANEIFNGLIAQGYVNLGNREYYVGESLKSAESWLNHQIEPADLKEEPKPRRLISDLSEPIED